MLSSKYNGPSESKRGRPRDPARLQGVLNAAASHFMQYGFDRTSLEAVARDAGVSRVTIYKYYATKDRLFESVVQARVAAYLGRDLFAGCLTSEPREALRRIGQQFGGLMRDEGVLRLHRTLISEAERHPELCRMFFEQGPSALVRGVAAFLESCNRAGSLRVSNPSVAADQFLALFLGSGHIGTMLGLQRPSAQTDSDRLEANLELFLASLVTNTKS